jgi:GNAT superfamily N-acetyltransferase
MLEDNKMNIKIVYSDFSTPNEIINELMKIESDVYEPDYRGKYASIEKRFKKNKDMFILAYDDTNIIGYLCFFPISQRLHEELLMNDDFHDDDILPDDVKHITESPYIYFLSIALYKKYQGLEIGRAMVEAFLNKMKEEIKSGNVIDDIIASVVTSQGEHIMKKYGFELVKDCMDTPKYKLYRKDGKDI